MIGLSLVVEPERLGMSVPWIVAATGGTSALGLGMACAIRAVGGEDGGRCRRLIPWGAIWGLAIGPPHYF